MTTTVSALLVCHDGARWLPAVLEGLAHQTRPVDRVVCVDTGSEDDGPLLVVDRLGPNALVTTSADSSYGAAVVTGLDALTPAPSPAPSPSTGTEEEWVWLLHDDSNPTPGALESLLAAAADHPSAEVLGPKLREWPSLRRLLEVGVTISGTGRRETGLERGEYDQGQHDQVRDVLAVNTAGMLVRREVLEQVGFDEQLPVYGNDVDFGWRAARAGHRTLVVPDAVVFHVEAAHRGVRRASMTSGGFRRAERRAALYTLLVNCAAPVLPVQVVRLFLGSLLRAFALVLVRAPAEAVEELLALLSVYAHPVRIARGRAWRRRASKVRPREVRHLLAPTWLPYRHGLDFVGDLSVAVAHQAGDMSARRRAAGLEPAETGPVDAEAQNLPPDTGLLARLLTSPTAGVFAVLVLLALIGSHTLVGSGVLSGGALPPAPASGTDWWRTYLESWHQLGVGSSAPAAPYLLPLAVAATLLFGKAWLVLELVFVLAVPLAAYGGYRFLRLVTGSRLTALWGGVAYGVLPVVSGALPQGRLGTVVAAVLLPWLAHAVVFLGPARSDDRRWRAAWRTALLLGLLASFVPMAWVAAALTTLVAIVVGLLRDRRTWARSSIWGAAVVPVLAVPVLLLPWSALTWTHQGPGSVFFEAGLPAAGLTGRVTPWDVVLGHPADVAAAPAWLGAGLALAAVVALLRGDTRRVVLRAWVVVVVALAVTALAAAAPHALASSPVQQPAWLGFPLLLAQAAGITAAAAAASGVWARLSGSSFTWRQPIGAVVVVAALASPLLGLGWWLVHGSTGPVGLQPGSDVPTYMAEAAAANPAHGVLEVRGTSGTGFDYLLLRGPGLRLGDESVLPTVVSQTPVTRLVTSLVTAPTPSDVGRLSAHGVAFVYAPAPADPAFVASMDSLSGVTTGSATHRGARAWQVASRPSMGALPKATGSTRPWLLAVQTLAIVIALVLAAPSRRARP